jgi:predicted transcriptional regulator
MNGDIHIKSGKDFLKDLEEDWQAIDKGEPPPEPVHRILFESAEMLSKVITKQRHHLLKVLHGNGPVSVRALAALLDRDYKNVYTDVKILEESGLIQRNGRNHVMAPYEKLMIELPLSA